jgi:hypothetical protein
MEQIKATLEQLNGMKKQQTRVISMQALIWAIPIIMVTESTKTAKRHSGILRR